MPEKIKSGKVPHNRLAVLTNVFSASESYYLMLGMIIWSLSLTQNVSLPVLNSTDHHLLNIEFRKFRKYLGNRLIELSLLSYVSELFDA